MVGRLFGLSPAPASRCRVLELGCGDGANVLSIAQSLPRSTVVGIDAAGGAISRGQELARTAGIDNLDLRVGDLERLDGDLGTFDYVIAHGVYSWIPPRVRGALLRCCRHNLAPAGIAFVSYNAYPGSYLRDMTRDILSFHVRDVTDPQARLTEAHRMMRAIVEIVEPSPYARLLREHMERMLQSSDALLFHDDLAEISTPFYFYEFVEHATAHGLAFLSEADLAESRIHDVPASASELIDSLPDDVVVREQYLDFFKNRMFRQTLLCHAEAPLRREIDDVLLERMAVSSPVVAVEPDGPSAAEAAAEEKFTTPDGFTVATSEPLVRAALHLLARSWPEAIEFPELLAQCREQAAPDVAPELVAARLRGIMLEAYISRVVRLHGAPPPVRGRVSERPRASALARAQYAAGVRVVSSLLHANVRLEGEVEPALLLLLDGTRDPRALAEALGADQPTVDAALERFAKAGLLCG